MKMTSIVAVPIAAVALAAATLPAAAWSLPGELNYHSRMMGPTEASPSRTLPVSAEYMPLPPLDCATTLAGRLCADG